MFAKVLKKLRLENELTQKDLADYLKVTPKTISFYELGQRMPPADVLIKLSQRFNVSIDFLLGNNTIIDSSNRYSPEEKAIIDKYRQLDERGKRRVMRSVNDEYNDMLEDKKIREREIS